VGEPELESRRNQCGSTQDQSRSSSESGEVIGLPRTGAKECGRCGRARRRAIQEAASDSHADEMKKSWGVIVEGLYRCAKRRGAIPYQAGRCEVWPKTIPRRFMRILFHCRLSYNTVAPITSGKERIMMLLSAWARLVPCPHGDQM
jgi:hypothetical protein